MENKNHSGQHHNLPAKEFEELLRNHAKAVLLDVRTPDEFNAGHIPAAVNINVMDNWFVNSVSELDKSIPYFVYCRSGARSGRACLIMAEQGFTVYNLVGGIGSWMGNVVTA